MTTSPLEQYISQRSTIFDADEPVSAGESLVAANNILHLADSSAQVRVAWQGAITAPDTYEEDQGSVGIIYDKDLWYPLWTSGPLTLRVREDGSIYPLRVRLAGRAPTSLSLTFYLILTGVGTWGGARTALAAGTGSNTATFSTSSPTAAWLGTDLLEIDQVDQVSYALNKTMVATRETGGDQIDFPVVQGQIIVAVKGLDGASGSGKAELNGLNVAEFIGA